MHGVRISETNLSSGLSALSAALVSSGGATPRNLCLSPDGTLLLCCNQHGHNIVSFAVESATGQLYLAPKTAEVFTTAEEAAKKAAEA